MTPITTNLIITYCERPQALAAQQKFDEDCEAAEGKSAMCISLSLYVCVPMYIHTYTYTYTSLCMCSMYISIYIHTYTYII